MVNHPNRGGSLLQRVAYGTPLAFASAEVRAKVDASLAALDEMYQANCPDRDAAQRLTDRGLALAFLASGPPLDRSEISYVAFLCRRHLGDAT